jgi:hypothetical protein
MEEDKKHVCYAVKDGFYIIGDFTKSIKSDHEEKFYRTDYYVDVEDKNIYETKLEILNKDDKSMIAIDEYMSPSRTLINSIIDFSEYCPCCSRRDYHSVKLHNFYTEN